MEFNTKKRIKAEKNGDKDGKVLYKLMCNTLYIKAMEKLNECKTRKQQTRLLKMDIKTHKNIWQLFSGDT